MMLHFREPSKLKTKKLIFEDIYAARDSATLENLKELSSKRKMIEDSINQNSYITEAIAREMSGGLTCPFQQDLRKLEQYLPLLENLVYHVDLVGSNHQIARWTSELKIKWSSALSSSSFFNLMGPKFYQIDNLHFELGMVIFLYGAILRERALEVIASDLVQSATLFREAAGVFLYLSQKVFPSMQSTLPTEIPPEATSYMSTVMSLISLAEAQAVSIKKAEEKGTTVGLLAKLHYGVAEMLGEAIDVLYSANGQCKDISSRFMEFILSCKALHEFRSQKHLTESLKDAGQVGIAIGILRDALLNVKKKMPGEESHKSVFRKEIDVATDTLTKLEHENEFVWQQKIASGDELLLPKGFYNVRDWVIGKAMTQVQQTYHKRKKGPTWKHQQNLQQNLGGTAGPIGGGDLGNQWEETNNCMEQQKGGRELYRAWKSEQKIGVGRLAGEGMTEG